MLPLLPEFLVFLLLNNKKTEVKAQIKVKFWCEVVELCSAYQN